MNKCGKKNKINKTKLIESGIMGALVWVFFFFFFNFFMCGWKSRTLAVC